MERQRRFFNRVVLDGKSLWRRLETAEAPDSFSDLLWALDFVHIELGLLKAYGPDYPLVEYRELVPAFDAPLIEYKHLPAFSLVIFDRRLSYSQEGFQFDLLLRDAQPFSAANAAFNRSVLRKRSPRNLVPALDKLLGRRATTSLKHYRKLLPYLVSMDRAHIISRDKHGTFRLSGIYASLPSDLDGEIKRLGGTMGKWLPGDDRSYFQSRNQVYRFLMEQSGLPICGERHTSAALFSRRLMRRRKAFAVKVLGTSDRTITSFSSLGAKGGLPAVSKTSLVQVGGKDHSLLRRLREGGYFFDPERGVVILRVGYLQHAYHPDNVLENRAISVAWQQVVHPHSGETIDDLDILGLGSDRLLQLNDIVRGETTSTIVYQGREQVRADSGLAQRLKFIAAWLRKHRHILADYSPDNFELMRKVIGSFLNDRELYVEFQRLLPLYKEVKAAMSDVFLAHRLRLLEKLVSQRSDAYGRKLSRVQVLTILGHILAQEGDRVSRDHPKALKKLLGICRRELANPYLRRRYLKNKPQTSRERWILGEYKMLEALVERYEKQAA